MTVHLQQHESLMVGETSPALRLESGCPAVEGFLKEPHLQELVCGAPSRGSKPAWPVDSVPGGQVDKPLPFHATRVNRHLAV